MKGKKLTPVTRELINRASGALPAFTDIFDEETFYLFFFGLVICSFLVAYVACNYFDVQITDVGVIETRAQRDARLAREARKRKKPSWQ